MFLYKTTAQIDGSSRIT